MSKRNQNKQIKQVLTFVQVVTNEKTFVGVPYGMTGEDHTEFSFTILTKNGLLTFTNDQISEILDTTKEVFDLSTVDIQPTLNVPKTIRAKEIYAQNVDKLKRCEIIRLFMTELNMSKEGASTYFENIRKRAKRA